MLRKLKSMMTHRCPKCQFREGALMRHCRERVLNLFRIYRFHCNSCNINFHAILLR